MKELESGECWWNDNGETGEPREKLEIIPTLSTREISPSADFEPAAIMVSQCLKYVVSMYYLFII